QRPRRLCRNGARYRREVGRERGPRAVLDLGNVPAQVVLDDELLARRNADGCLLLLDGHAERLERMQHRDEVGLLDAVDRHVATGDRGEPDEAPDLDVVGADLPVATREGLDALDAKHVRLDAFDARAQRAEKAAEILYMRLA